MLAYNQKGSSQINQKATIIWRSHHKSHCVYDNWISWRSSKLMFSCTTSNGSKQIHLTLILHSLLALSFNLIWVFFRVKTQLYQHLVLLSEGNFGVLWIPSKIVNNSPICTKKLRPQGHLSLNKPLCSMQHQVQHTNHGSHKNMAQEVFPWGPSHPHWTLAVPGSSSPLPKHPHSWREVHYNWRERHSGRLIWNFISPQLEKKSNHKSMETENI